MGQWPLGAVASVNHETNDFVNWAVSDGLKSGQYVSYLNAFLLPMLLTLLKITILITICPLSLQSSLHSVVTPGGGL